MVRTRHQSLRSFFGAFRSRAGRDARGVVVGRGPGRRGGSTPRPTHPPAPAPPWPRPRPGRPPPLGPARPDGSNRSLWAWRPWVERRKQGQNIKKTNPLAPAIHPNPGSLFFFLPRSRTHTRTHAHTPVHISTPTLHRGALIAELARRPGRHHPCHPSHTTLGPRPLTGILAAGDLTRTAVRRRPAAAAGGREAAHDELPDSCRPGGLGPRARMARVGRGASMAVKRRADGKEEREKREGARARTRAHSGERGRKKPAPKYQRDLGAPRRPVAAAGKARCAPWGVGLAMGAAG